MVGMSRRVAFVTFAACQPLDLVGPHQVFAVANELLSRAHGREPGYELCVYGATRTPLRSEGGLTLVPDASFATLSRARSLHTLVVVGGEGARRAAKDRETVALVQRVAQRAKRVTSVCTGAFVLAAAGMLDGRRATTHWARCAELARHYPSVQVEEAPIYVRDGHVWSSAGVTAGIDLALALVEEDHGRALASEIARWLVVFVRRAGGQAQFSAQLSAQSAERAPLRELMAWVVEHPDQQLDVPSLAGRVHMSVRNFSRLFRAETGVSPAAYVERIRVETARRLLETSEHSVEQVAARAGFGTPEALRRAFARRMQLSPREYRARFGAHRKEPS